ncbi:hypothetical protein JDS79_32320, partial [Bacillus cereus]|nr:hypothetical protein [Bacillus cereus]
MESKQALYGEAVQTLSDGEQTTLILVTRPEASPLVEAGRASSELRGTGIAKQLLVINGGLTDYSVEDKVAVALYNRQAQALEQMPKELEELSSYSIPLAPFNVIGIEHLREFFQSSPSCTAVAATASADQKHTMAPL